MESTQNIFWTDAAFDSCQALTKNQAVARSAVISNVSYKLTMALVQKSETYHGFQTAKFSLSEVNDQVFFDFKGRAMHALEINGKALNKADHPDVWSKHKVALPAAHLKVGDNEFKIAFEAKYVTDCDGMQKFIDNADGEEYLYSNSEPFSAHIWFPCFDQPDLKAPYELLVMTSANWLAVSTTNANEHTDKAV